MTQLSLSFEALLNEEPERSRSGETEKQCSLPPVPQHRATTAPPAKAEAMRRDAFIAAHRQSFVRYTSGRNIIGIECADGRVLTIPSGCQERGRLLRPVDDILGDIHHTAVEEEITRVLRRSTPPPAGFPRHDVLTDYPDLQRSVQLGLTPSALAAMDAQPSSYLHICSTSDVPPRSLAELKRTIRTGVSLTRYSVTDPEPLHLVVRRAQTTAFVAGPIIPIRQYAEGLWHDYQPAGQYSFGRMGFDAELKNGVTVRYRYGHVPIDHPCPELG
jgi:hypothetical protein